MRRRKRTTTVTFETERVLISGGSAAARCDVCSGSPMVALNEAARLACVNELTLYRLVEARSLHHCETAGGQLLVCLNSLTQQARKH